MNESAVPGQSDPAVLLGSMRPVLKDRPFAFLSVSEEEFGRLTFLPLCVFRETEGVTLIVARSQAGELGRPADPAWACITLSVHSSLLAVGFLAAVTAALASEGISVNPGSAFHHDHLFVPWERRRDAMRILRALSRAPETGTGSR
jgi:hypothetical protein